jgi:GntR family transcriptional regulator
MSRPRRTCGNIVKRNVATDGPGYSFPSATGGLLGDQLITASTPFRVGESS